MRIGFRADSSVQIGTGHVMRCLTLADALRERGAQSIFVCRPHRGHLMDLIERRGHEVVALPVLKQQYIPLADTPIHSAWLGTDHLTDAKETCVALGKAYLDWMIVDHYALDWRWESLLRSQCGNLMAIDDLADRSHDCDLLLDQNLGRTADDYRGLVPEIATVLIGPEYALLRPEFARLRPQSLARRTPPKLNRLLIAMGGVDKDNATGAVLAVLNCCELPQDMQITVVMGPDAPWLGHLRDQVAVMRQRAQVLVGVANMAQLMSESDLAIGAMGSTSWERCCMGLPTLALVLAENQRSGATALQKIGAALVVERVSEIGEILKKLLDTDRAYERMSSLSKAATQVTDGCGIDRICNLFFEDKYV